MADRKLFWLSMGRKWWVLIAIGTGTLMSALDGSVVNTTLPVITRHFETDLSLTSWVVTVYLLVLSGLLLTFGRLGDLYGHKRMYASGFAVFILGSCLCVWSPTVGALIGARAFQAIGAAILQANSPAILTTNFPARQRGQALGMQAAMTYLGLLIGPTVGGYMASAFGWRSIFLINLPIGSLALALSILMIPGDEAVREPERFDVPGALSFLIGLVALLFGLNRGSVWGWSSPATIGVLAGALLVLGIFVQIERKTIDPMLDLTLFRSRVFSAATASAILNFMSLYGILLLAPFYLIQARALPPERAGLILSVQSLAMALMAPIAGTLSDRFGSRLLAGGGLGIQAFALMLTSGLGPETALSRVAAYLALMGLGVGLFGSPNNSALMGAAPRDRQGIAAGILATARNGGMALGVGISSALFHTMQSSFGGLGSPDPFFQGFRGTLLALAGFALAGMLVALSRGSSSRPATPGS